MSEEKKIAEEVVGEDGNISAESLVDLDEVIKRARSLTMKELSEVEYKYPLRTKRGQMKFDVTFTPLTADGKVDGTAEVKQMQFTACEVFSDGRFIMDTGLLEEPSSDAFEFNIDSQLFRNSWKISEDKQSALFHTATHSVRVCEKDIFNPWFNIIVLVVSRLIRADGTCETCHLKNWKSTAADVDPNLLFDICHLFERNHYRQHKSFTAEGCHHFKSMDVMAFCHYRFIHKDSAEAMCNFLVAFKDQLVAADCHTHWSSLFLDHIAAADFKRLLKVFGVDERDANGRGALYYAVDSGKGEFIQAALECERAADSRGTGMIETELSDCHLHWSETCSLFVNEYMRKQLGDRKSREVLSALRRAFIAFLKDQGDITRLDVLGLLWHSDVTKDAVWQSLKLKSRSILDYDTLHKSQVDWAWFRDTVMKHPLWLEDLEEEMRYSWLQAVVRSEDSSKKGLEIRKAMEALIETGGVEEWTALCEFELAAAKSVRLRQDAVAGAPKANWDPEELNWILLNSSSFEFDPFKACDLNAYVTELRTAAHYLNPGFEQLLGSRLSLFGDVRIGPVKTEARIRSKTETDYSDTKQGYEWPFSAHVLDMIRCSVTVDTLPQLNSALLAFADECNDADSPLFVIRCKNGFERYARSKSIPAEYCDVKLNVAFRKDGRAIIGEVQFLLQCILDSKKKGHELYEVSRFGDTMRAAHTHLHSKNAWTHKLLVCAADSKAFGKLLSQFAHRFRAETLTKPLLEKGISTLELIAMNQESWRGQHLERLIECLLQSDAQSLAQVIGHCADVSWWIPLISSPSVALWTSVLLPTDALKADWCTQKVTKHNPFVSYLLRNRNLQLAAARLFVPRSNQSAFWRALSFAPANCAQLNAWFALWLLTELMPDSVSTEWRASADATAAISDSRKEVRRELEEMGVWSQFDALLQSHRTPFTDTHAADAKKSGFLSGLTSKKAAPSKGTLVSKALRTEVKELLKDWQHTALWRKASPMDCFALFAKDF